MKIAYIFAYFGDGGAEENAFLLARQAKKSGHKVIFIISKSSEAASKRLHDEKIKVIHLSMESSFNIMSVCGSVAGLKKLIKDEEIDIVHSHMLREQSIGVFAKLSGSNFKLIRTFHRFDQFNNKMKLLMPLYHKYTDAIISISSQMTKYLNKNKIHKKMHLIKNGVEKVEVIKHERALGFIGRLTKEKGIFNFIRANIEILRSNKLVIAGDGPEYDEIKVFVNKNNLNIELMGKVVDKTEFYKKISVLVLPSETEVLPLVILEAYSCGLPVIAFKLNSMVGLVEKENGALINYPDYKQMGIEAVQLMAKSDNFKKTNYKKYNAEYSVEQMWEQTDALYKRLADINEK